MTIIGIDVGKCVDFCQGTPEYEIFVTEHDFSINHVGYAGSMESAGIVGCFKSSLAFNKLRYTKYIGDGNSKSYPDIVAADTYVGVVVENMNVLDMFKKELVQDYGI